MDTGRRSFLGFFVSVPALTWSLAKAQAPPPHRPPRLPEPFPETEGPESEKSPKIDTRRVLKRNQREIKEDVEKLFQFAEDLRKEVNKTNSAEILSLPLIHEAEEIEKLARQIKNLARG